MKNLKDLIDKPILKTVALLNILGFKTVWSCCGYNYPGDVNRCHQMGQSYFIFDILKSREDVKNLLPDILSAIPETWRLASRQSSDPRY